MNNSDSINNNIQINNNIKINNNSYNTHVVNANKNIKNINNPYNNKIDKNKIIDVGSIYKYTDYNALTIDHANIYPIKHNDTWDSFEQIMRASIGVQGNKLNNRKFELFQQFCDIMQSVGKYIPTIADLQCGKRITELNNLVMDYLTYRWNKTHNLGKTLIADVDAFIYIWKLNGCLVSRASFPWLQRFGRGCNNKAQNEHGKKVNNMKYAIMNPQLQIMYTTARDPHVRMAMLFQHRFVLRSEHYTTPPKQTAKDVHYKKDCIRMKDVEFIPSFGFAQKLKITIYKDKNHKIVDPMHRIVRCTCHLQWLCVVHEFKKYVEKYKKQHTLDAPAIGGKDKFDTVNYNRMLNITKKVVQDMGDDDSNYGTHSFRAGGATELHCEGRSPLYIRDFGHWKSMSSVDGYIRPRNGDMIKYILDWDEYRDKRRAETGRTECNTIVITKYVKS